MNCESCETEERSWVTLMVPQMVRRCNSSSEGEDKRSSGGWGLGGNPWSVPVEPLWVSWVLMP